MLKPIALLTMTAAFACAGGRDVAPAAGPASGPGSLAPRLSQNGDRTVLSWLERDASGTPTLRYALRTHGVWAAPQTAARDASIVSDTGDVPGVVPVADGGLAAHWTVGRGGSKDARDLVVAVSKDGGASWSAPAKPHRDDTATEHGMATLVPAASGGGFGICWLDGRAGAMSEYGEGGTSLYWADWEGGAFGPERALDTRVCDCCKTGAALLPTGPVVAYRDRDASDVRDTSFVRETAAAWSEPRPVHADGWTLSACPTNGPAIVVRGDRMAVAWFTGAKPGPGVWAAVSTDGGATLGSPVRIDGGAPVGRVNATMLADGSTAIVWLERKGTSAEVSARRLGPDGALTPPVVVATTSPARASGYPSIAVEGERVVLVAWTETGTPGHVRAASVTLP